MRYEDENPGEWQVDPKTGERYRMIGRIKEYELIRKPGSRWMCLPGSVPTA